MITLSTVNQKYGGTQILWDLDLSIKTWLSHMHYGPKRGGLNHFTKNHHGVVAY